MQGIKMPLLIKVPIAARRWFTCLPIKQPSHFSCGSDRIRRPEGKKKSHAGEVEGFWVLQCGKRQCF